MLPRRSPPPTAKRVAVTVAETTRPRTDVALDTQLDRRRQDAQRRRQQQQWSIREGLATERCPLSSTVISATNPTARRWSGYSNSRGPASWIMMRTPTATDPRCRGSPCRRSVPPRSSRSAAISATNRTVKPIPDAPPGLDGGGFRRARRC
ncbi:unnamed protein product, partial [Musa acuminata subsp. burmannicoides]